MEIPKIERKIINKLKRKLNTLNKNLSSICDEEYLKSDDFTEKIYFINQNINNLENFIDMLNIDLKYNIGKNNILDNYNDKIKKLKEQDQEAQDIIDKFLPLMLYYQMTKI